MDMPEILVHSFKKVKTIQLLLNHTAKINYFTEIVLGNTSTLSDSQSRFWWPPGKEKDVQGTAEKVSIPRPQGCFRYFFSF